MKILSETRGLKMLADVREDLREQIQHSYEPRAKNCLTCKTQGACCLDAHFVNVRVSRLEAVAMMEVIERLPEEKRDAVFARVEAAITEYDLANGSIEKFACPLFEKGTGCLVHAAKPLPCIQHACYDREEDLPPDELLEEAERKVERLNQRVYGNRTACLPMPMAIGRKRKL